MTYDWYFKALEVGGGRRLTREQQKFLGVTHEPRCGFFRKRSKQGPDEPVAIWRDDTGLVALSAGKIVAADDVWTWCCDWPISEETYRAVAERGEAWPDEAPSAEVGIGHNSGDTDPFEALRAELAGEAELVSGFLGSAVKTQDDADKCGVWAKRIADIAKRADKERETEKAPYLQKCREIDGKWRPVIDDAKNLASRLKKHVEPFLIEQKRKAEEAARKAREEAERQRQEAMKAQDDEARAAALKAAQEAERSTKATNASAGRTGARVAVRVEKVGVVTDYTVAAVALVEMKHPDMMRLIDQLANRAARSGMPFDGMEIQELEKVA